MSQSTPDQIEERKAVRLIVIGRVQGVGFRHFTRMAALRIGVSGWVRNNYDSTVEIWAEGTQHELHTFQTEVKRGPSRSNVTHIEAAWFTPKNTYRSFTTKS